MGITAAEAVETSDTTTNILSQHYAPLRKYPIRSYRIFHRTFYSFRTLTITFRKHLLILLYNRFNHLLMFELLNVSIEMVISMIIWEKYYHFGPDPNTRDVVDLRKAYCSYNFSSPKYKMFVYCRYRKSDVSSAGPSSERKTTCFMFQFVSQHCLHNTLRLFKSISEDQRPFAIPDW